MLESQSVGDVFRLLNHLGVHPPTYVILAAVHGVKDAAAPHKASELSDEDYGELLGAFGQPSPMSAAMRELALWAENEKKKLKIN